MFTIEHDFDATVITLIDDARGIDRALAPDVTITAFDDQVVLEQAEPESDAVVRIVFSMDQLQELRAALNLPEGSYRLERRPG